MRKLIKRGKGYWVVVNGFWYYLGPTRAGAVYQYNLKFKGAIK